VGVAAVGAAAAAPAIVNAPAAAPVAGRAGSGPLVAYVRDLSAGTVSILVGEREVLVTDHELVGRLAGAAGRAGTDVVAS
jgi:hypothetical protein